jgi:glycosyltransferase involved in cell wall biosynthesis
MDPAGTTRARQAGTYLWMKVSILIAVYNEAATVAALLERVWAQAIPGLSREIVIVESNSTDGSRQIVAQFLQHHLKRQTDEGSPAIQLILQEKPQGKGHAIRQAFAAAKGDIFLIQDADLEYDVSDYPALLAPILDRRCAFVLGSRHMGPNRWNIRKFARGRLQAAIMNMGGMLFHRYFNLVFGSHLTDPTSMYKVFRAECLDGLSLHCDRFDFDFELLGKLMRAGFVPLEVPVSYHSRGFDEGKKIRVIRDPVSWLPAILGSRFGTLYVDTRRAGVSHARARL